MKKSIVFLHLALWFLLLLGQCISVYSVTFIPLVTYAYANVYLQIGTPVFFYLSYFLLFKVIRNKRSLLFISLVLLAVCLLLFLVQQQVFGFVSYIIGRFIFWGMMGGLFRFFIDWLNKDQLQLKLSKQNLQSELALLRNQVSPHFLFNSLHNIDALIAVNPEKASDSLLKLSELMRYTIYEADTELIDLSKEVDYLEKYVGLQQLRYENETLVTFNVVGKVEGIGVAPMLFVPFVENAFKHITDKETSGGLSISLQVNGSLIVFEVINVYDEQKLVSKDASNGIGLNNVRRRLALIYPNRHTLDITTEKNQYHVKLSIDTHVH